MPNMPSDTPRTDTLSVLEAPFWEYGNGALRQHAAIVATLDGSPSADEIASRFAGRLDWCGRLTSVIVDRGGQFRRPYFSDDPNFDFDNHFHCVQVPGDGTLEGFSRFFSAEFHKPFDATRPQWDVWYAPGIDGGSMIALRAHHAMLDGLSGIEWFRAVSDQSISLDDAQHGVRTSHARALEERRRPEPDAAGTDTANSGPLGSALEILGSRPEPLWPQQVGPERLLTWGSLSMPAVKQIRAATSTSTAAVVQTMMSYALETLAADLPGDVTVSMPMSVRHLFQALYPLDLSSRQISSPLGLTTVEKAPLARLAEMQRRVSAVKLSRKNFLRAAELARMAPRKLLLAAAKQKMARSNFISAPCAGPREQFTIGDTKITDIALHTGMVPNNPMSMGATAYLDNLSVGITADPTIVPRAVELPKAMAEALKRILAEVG